MTDRPSDHWSSRRPHVAPRTQPTSADFLASGYGAAGEASASSRARRLAGELGEPDAATPGAALRDLANARGAAEEDGAGEGGDDAAGNGDGDGSQRRRRRAVLAGLAATALAGVGAGLKLLFSRDGAPDSPVEQRPVDTGFANRDDSYVASAGPPPVPSEPLLLYPTASEAAAATQVVVPTILATDDPVIHLLRRATFGLTPALVDEVHTKGIDAWIAEQLAPETIPDTTADGVWAQFPLASMGPAEIRGSIERYGWEAMNEYTKAALGRQIWSSRQLFEVVVDFWANHLNAPMPAGHGWDNGPAYHNDVIRQHALGTYTDMLLAAMQHPAMLRYLSNDKSHKDAVNENLGRELLELHTVGVGSGYTEDDVRNSAYILTGRTVGGQGGTAPEGLFVFDPRKHWTGPVQVLDFYHDNASADGGMEVGEAYVRHLAAHPATAGTIAHKLAVRFVADSPPQSLVDRLATAYLESGTAIVPVLDVLFRSGEFWAAVGQKTRRPLENVVASLRTLEVQPGQSAVGPLEDLYWRTRQMGHEPLGWPAPNGYPDVHPAWRSTSGLLHTWNVHRDLVKGWEGLTTVPAATLAGDRPRATVGEYVDSLCQRLCQQTLQPAHRDAIVGFVGVDQATPTEQSEMDALVGEVAPLILDSPYFALR